MPLSCASTASYCLISCHVDRSISFYHYGTSHFNTVPNICSPHRGRCCRKRHVPAISARRIHPKTGAIPESQVSIIYRQYLGFHALPRLLRHGRHGGFGTGLAGQTLMDKNRATEYPAAFLLQTPFAAPLFVCRSIDALSVPCHPSYVQVGQCAPRFHSRFRADKTGQHLFGQETPAVGVGEGVGGSWVRDGAGAGPVYEVKCW